MCARQEDKFSGPEQRKFRRVPLGASVECRAGFEVYHGKAENISVSGLLVRSENQSEPDTDLQVKFLIPGMTPSDSVIVQARARVAHLVPGVFMGLEFTQIPDSTRMAIEWYVDSVPPQIINA
jgi:hypothetical protein